MRGREEVGGGEETAPRAPAPPAPPRPPLLPPPGELNGKAANLNHAPVPHLPPRRRAGPGDAVAVFDADAGARARHFHARAPPPLSESDAVALVLTPPNALPTWTTGPTCSTTATRTFGRPRCRAPRAWGAVVCTGTNLILRAAALAAGRRLPGRSVTEDHVLGHGAQGRGGVAGRVAAARRARASPAPRPLRAPPQAAGYEMRYVPRYLAVGEAPEQGAISRQRSRWAKGHAAAFFSVADNPLLKPGLPLASRLVYASGFISFAATALAAPLLAVAPAVAAKWGVAPAALTPALARALVPHVLLLHAVAFCVPCGPRLARALAFNAVSGRLLWWAYAKAIANAALRAVGLKSAARFKTTLKTGAAVAAGGAGAPRAGERGPAPAAPRSPARRRVPPPAFDDDGGYGGGPAPGGALERVFTMPEVLAALAARPGERPAWDADAPPPSDAEYGSLTFESLRLGALRDVWAPLAAGAAAAAASVALALALARGTAPPLAAVGALWGAASALPPALLLLYALGVRGAGARRACAAALALAALAGGERPPRRAPPRPRRLRLRGRAGEGVPVLRCPEIGALGGGRQPRAVARRQRHARLRPPRRRPRRRLLRRGRPHQGVHVHRRVGLAARVGAARVSGRARRGGAGGRRRGARAARGGVPAQVPHQGRRVCGPGGRRGGGGGRAGARRARARTDAPPRPPGRRLQGRPRLLGPPRGHGRPGHGAPALRAQRDAPGQRFGGPKSAAALAGAAKVFEADDPNFARTCIVHAKKLYKFAKARGGGGGGGGAGSRTAGGRRRPPRPPQTRQGKFSDSVPDLGLVYRSSAYRDDLAWAAAWIALRGGRRGLCARSGRLARRRVEARERSGGTTT